MPMSIKKSSLAEFFGANEPENFPVAISCFWLSVTLNIFLKENFFFVVFLAMISRQAFS